MWMWRQARSRGCSNTNNTGMVSVRHWPCLFHSLSSQSLLLIYKNPEHTLSWQYHRVTHCKILYITDGGEQLARKIGQAMKGTSSILDCRKNPDKTIRDAWKEANCLVFIMATGIVVRKIAKLLEDKYSDPCVIVTDEKGRYVISLLSGHLGGGNELARKIADITNGNAVITTASDVLGHTAIDIWAKEHGLVPEDRKKFAKAAGILVNKGKIHIYSNCGLPDLPHDMKAVTSPDNADVIITIKSDLSFNKLVLHPRNLIAGIGCNRGTSAEDIEKAFNDTITRNGIARLSIKALATIDAKRDEDGLLQFAKKADLPLLFFSKEEMNRVKGIDVSHAAIKAVGAKGVAEPAAIIGANHGKLIVKKIKYRDVTVAIAIDNDIWPPKKTTFTE